MSGSLKMHTSSLMILRSVCSSSSLNGAPLFLIPSLQAYQLNSTSPSIPSSRHAFSTTTSLQMRKIKAIKPPPNKNRGVSAIRQTGPRHPLTVAKYPLPEPVWDPPLRRQIQKTRSDHGLWGFFRDTDKQISSLTSPEQVSAHGRAWAYHELQNKGWDDLATIWWSCLKERNWLATEKLEIQRMNAGVGQGEIKERDSTVSASLYVFLLFSISFEAPWRLRGLR